MPVSNVSFTISLYKSEQLGNGKYPVVLLITWRNDKQHIRRKRLGISCFLEEWDNETNRVKSDVWGAYRLNDEIEASYKRAENIYWQFFHNESWNYKNWSTLFDKSPDKVTFDSFTKDYVKRLHLMNRSSSAMYYFDVLKAIQKFLRKEEIAFEEITKQMLKDFERNIINRGFKGDRTMRGLKVLYSKAIEEEVIEMRFMPFKTAYNPIGYKFTHLKKIKKKTSLIKRLSKAQIKNLFAYIPLNEGEEKALDLWKFSYYTMGVNLKDIAQMKFTDIQDGLWYFERSKTSNSSMGKPLLEECMEIVHKYYKEENKYVFDFILGDKYDISDQSIHCRVRDTCSNLRRRYKKISKKLNFDGHFSIYSARYTSATISANSGADMRAVQANLTHASIRTTEIYSQFRDQVAMKRSLELLRL